MKNSPSSSRARIQWAKNRMARNYFCIFGICGEPGSGKSTLARLMARKLDPNWSPRKHLVFGEKNVIPLAKTLPSGSVIVCDEGDESGNKMRSMSSEGVSVGEYLDKARKLGQTYIFVRPYYDDFNKSIKRHFHWVDLVTRIGEAEAYESFTMGKWKTFDWKQPRFKYEFPSDEVVDPVMAAEYAEVIGELVRSESPTKFLEARRQGERLRGILNNVLGYRRLLP